MQIYYVLSSHNLQDFFVLYFACSDSPEQHWNWYWINWVNFTEEYRPSLIVDYVEADFGMMFLIHIVFSVYLKSSNSTNKLENKINQIPGSFFDHYCTGFERRRICQMVFHGVDNSFFGKHALDVPRNLLNLFPGCRLCVEEMIILCATIGSDESLDSGNFFNVRTSQFCITLLCFLPQVLQQDIYPQYHCRLGNCCFLFSPQQLFYHAYKPWSLSLPWYEERNGHKLSIYDFSGVFSKTKQ